MKKLMSFTLFVCCLITGSCLAKEVEVIIHKMKFTPQQVVIAPGDTVVWLNKEKRQYHSVWFKQFQQEEPDYFFPDESFSQRFDKEGSYPYLCGPHPEMTGTVIVKTPN